MLGLFSPEISSFAHYSLSVRSGQLSNEQGRASRPQAVRLVFLHAQENGARNPGSPAAIKPKRSNHLKDARARLAVVNGLILGECF